MESTNYNLQNSIQSLVSGDLDAEEKKRLVEQARNNPEVADELAFGQSLALALRHRDTVAVSAMLSAIIAEEGFPPPAPTGTSGWAKWGGWVAGASILIVSLLGLYTWADRSGYFASEAQKLSRQHLQHLENVFFIGNTPQSPVLLQQGMAAYDAKRYPEAAALLGQYLDTRPDNAARVYLGVSLLLSGQSDRATGALADAAQSEEPPIREAAQWHLALAYLENDQPEAAQSLLETIPTDGIYADQARALLEKIRQND
jgi:hypothetical protein